MNSEVPLTLKIRPNRAANFYSVLVWRMYLILVFLGLLPKRKYWGVIYDSVSKQPLDPAVVKLVYADKNLVQTCITDLRGRYGFLAEPGEFKILVRKTNYKFPSEIVKGKQDGIYENLYHGEFLKLFGGSEVVAPSIPLDPIVQDWNQTAKKSVVNESPYLTRLIHALVQIIFWTGLILTMVFSAFAFPKIPAGLMGLLIGYIVLMLLPFVLPQPRLWSQLKSSAVTQAPEHFLLELENPKMPGVSFGSTDSTAEGIFFFLAQPGKYILYVKKLDRNKKVAAVGSVAVKIPKQGVLSGSFFVS